MSRYFVDKHGCAHHHNFAGVDMFTMCGEKMTLSLVEIEPHGLIPPHSHPHEQIGMMLEGEAVFTIGDETRTVRAGDMWRIPGHIPHTITAGDRAVRALDAFYPIREDYR